MRAIFPITTQELSDSFYTLEIYNENIQPYAETI